MTDSTNNSFEEQWQHAFDNTELTPPESVWEKIELGLKPENTLPSKPNFGNKPYYFLGGILVGILGLFLWFNNTEKQVQVVEKEEVKTEKTVVKNRPNISQKDIEVVADDIKYKTNKFVEVVGGDTNHGASGSENYTMEEPLFVVSSITTTEEIPQRTLTDSVEMIEPLATKSIHSEIENPMIILPTDQTPYYVKPTPKPQKKSILKNIKISVGAGVYQQ
jgi:hypothetical protein